MARTTIKDIARELGISPSTVSRALREHPDISAATRDRVRQEARRLNYQPDQIAKSLQTRRTNTLGVVVPEIRHDFFSQAISGIEDVAGRAGYVILLCQSNETLEREELNLATLVSHRVDGVLISLSRETTEYDHLQNVLDQGVPLVMFDRVARQLDAGRVVADDEGAACLAVEHLIERGYKRVAHIGGAPGIYISGQRRRGFERAMREAGLEIDPDYVLAEGFHEEDGYRGANRLMELEVPPRAIFAVNDPAAVGAYNYLREHGHHIPRDVALVGFSNNPVAAWLQPGLTTVDQSAFEMGQSAARMLIRTIQTENRDKEAVTMTMPARLIIRESS